METHVWRKRSNVPKLSFVWCRLTGRQSSSIPTLYHVFRPLLYSDQAFVASSVLRVRASWSLSSEPWVDATMSGEKRISHSSLVWTGRFRNLSGSVTGVTWLEFRLEVSDEHMMSLDRWSAGLTSWAYCDNGRNAWHDNYTTTIYLGRAARHSSKEVRWPFFTRMSIIIQGLSTALHQISSFIF